MTTEAKNEKTKINHREGRYTEQFHLRPTSGRDVQFTGSVMASWDSGESCGRGRAITLYQTCGGSWVVEEDRYTIWDGEQSTTDVQVFKTLDELKGHLGYDRVAKRLYGEARIDVTVEID